MIVFSIHFRIELFTLVILSHIYKTHISKRYRFRVKKALTDDNNFALGRTYLNNGSFQSAKQLNSTSIFRTLENAFDCTDF